MDRLVLILLSLGLVAGCKFAPRIDDGAVRCGAGGACPSGLSCAVDGTCRRAPSGGGEDLGLGDDASTDDLASTATEDLAAQDLSGADLTGQDLAGADLVCVKALCPGNGCGMLLDGCGGVLDCGTKNCGSGKACGAKQLNQCGPGSCTPLPSCGAAGKNCGLLSNGCDDVLDCGPCATGTCGGGGVANVCG